MKRKSISKRAELKMKRGKRRIILGENEKKIILAVGAGVLVLGAMVFPTLPMVLQPIIRMRGRKGFLKLLKRLQDKGVIYLGGEKIKLTRKGLELQTQFKIEELILTKPDKWDGIWRLISYDIPDKYKKTRDGFRWTLIRLGFRKVQESLWVYPYDCKEEIAVIAKNLGIAPYVMVMITDSLPREEEWETEFDLNIQDE